MKLYLGLSENQSELPMFHINVSANASQIFWATKTLPRECPRGYEKDGVSPYVSGRRYQNHETA